MQEASSIESHDMAQSVGRYAAALALPLLSDVAAEAWARSHSLCTHISSLVLVDEAGEVSQGFSQMRKVPMMEARMADVGLSRPRAIGEPLMRSTDGDRLFSASYRAPETLNRVLPRLTQVSTPAPKKPGPGIGSIAKIIARLLPAAPDQDRFQIFAGFTWDRFGDDLLAHDLISLTPSQIEVLQGLEDQLVAAAKTQGNIALENGQATIFALGLIAQSQGGRLASRFARRALKDAPVWVKLHI
jgi:hypothetical protein